MRAIQRTRDVAQRRRAHAIAHIHARLILDARALTNRAQAVENEQARRRIEAMEMARDSAYQIGDEVVFDARPDIVWIVTALMPRAEVEYLVLDPRSMEVRRACADQLCSLADRDRAEVDRMLSTVMVDYALERGDRRLFETWAKG